MIGCLAEGWSIAIALLVGLAAFMTTGIHRGFTFRSLMGMAYQGARTSFSVLRILTLIGLLTALWRASGTIAFFAYYGISFITPGLFIVVTFLTTLILAFALGTSFGIAGTVGVMMMVLARSGGVNEIITAGAIMSGAYFGDRCSPASSSASLVAAVTGTDLYKNVKMMLKTGALPTLITLGVYVILSVRNPIETINQDILTALQNGFELSWIVVLPAMAMLILPLFKVKVSYAMTISIVIAFSETLMVQNQKFMDIITLCIRGYTPESPILAGILSGGGILSMVEVILIVSISCTYSGIFEGTEMLKGVHEKVGKFAGQFGLFPTQIILGTVAAATFCNQTVPTILNAQILGVVYAEKGKSKEEMAIDMENSLITIAGLIPWCIACNVPLGVLGVGFRAVPYSVLLYMIPLCYLFTKKIWYKSL